MANIRSFETKETLLIDAGALKAKATIALSHGDQKTAYNFNRAADKLLRKADVVVPEGVVAPKGKETKQEETQAKPRRHRRTKAEMEAARTQAANSNTAESPKRGRSKKVKFNVGDTVNIPRGVHAFSDDPKVPSEGRPAGRSYKVTISEVDQKAGRIGWKGNAGYTYWATAAEVTLAVKGEEGKAA